MMKWFGTALYITRRIEALVCEENLLEKEKMIESMISYALTDSQRATVVEQIDYIYSHLDTYIDQVLALEEDRDIHAHLNKLLTAEHFSSKLLPSQRMRVEAELERVSKRLEASDAEEDEPMFKMEL
jgi:hypothetical protein